VCQVSAATQLAQGDAKTPSSAHESVAGLLEEESASMVSEDTSEASETLWSCHVRTALLPSGLRLVVGEDPAKPLVSTALWYGVGTRDETPSQSGLAHFLEHMMFKGSSRFGPGEVDRITQGLGGGNNAFTSHDATVYTFNLPGSSWQTALEIEADRLVALNLDPAEVESERAVVLEEIAMYQSDPWDALDQAVTRELFLGHPYAEPVLGHPERMAEHDAAALRGFLKAHYRLDNAVLAVAGACTFDQVLEKATELFPGEAQSNPTVLSSRPGVPAAAPRDGLRRIERRRGETPRMLYAMQGPRSTTREHASWRLALAVLAAGRSSRLHQRLVEQERSATWVSADLSETVGPSTATITLEVTPGVEPQRAEASLLAELERLVTDPPSDEELRRVRRLLRADFVFSHERTSRQVVALGAEEMLFGRGHSHRALASLEEVGGEELLTAARRLNPERGAVLGWSLPTLGQHEPPGGEES
jgi:zinc protease